LIAQFGFAPPLEALGEKLGLSLEDTERALQRLDAAHALLLHPGTSRPWVVHPFALAPGSCWVQTPQHGYWANCLYCACGIAAALHCDATLTTRLGGEAETVQYKVVGGELLDTGDLFHLSTPARRWWDNVIFACSSFQPFRAERDIDDWCRRHALPRGAVMSLPQLWRFASEWYGSYLVSPWRKRSLEQAESLFARHGLMAPFWSMR
jgi:hypothetical protein